MSVRAAAASLREPPPPSASDVGENLEEALWGAGGGEVREAEAQVGVADVECGAIVGVVGVEPAAAGEEPGTGDARRVRKDNVSHFACKLISTNQCNLLVH